MSGRGTPSTVSAPVGAQPPLRSFELDRRRWLGWLSVPVWAPLLWPRIAMAGGQIEEPLIDSVRTALSSAIANHAPPVPEFPDTESRIRYLRWLGTMMFRLRRRKPDHDTRKEFLQTAWYESTRAGLDVSQTNLRFGCVILRHYLDRERGDLFLALGRYNGSRGKAAYPDAVFGARKNWLFDGR